MRFLADMGIAQSTVKWLKSQGYEAKHLREEGLQKLPDEDIYSKAKKEKSIILTFDLDFGEIAAAAGENLPSIIIFRLQDARPANVNRLLEIVLNETSEDLEKGAIISVNEHRYRIRRLPITPDPL